MKFLLKLISGKWGRSEDGYPSENATSDVPRRKSETIIETPTEDPGATLDDVMAALSDEERAAELGKESPDTADAEQAAASDGTSNVNIWDIEEEDAPAADTTAAPASARGRRNRNKTRLLGFEPQDTPGMELFKANTETPEPEEPAEPATPAVMFPVGWVVVVDGPGRGASFPLLSGVSQIGRGGDQAVALAFGDMSISRANHAAIAYDPAAHTFHLGHGGKSNLVRLNSKPLLSTEELKDSDEFVIGETTLRLRTLCGPDFNWDTDPSEGEEHVAIA